MNNKKWDHLECPDCVHLEAHYEYEKEPLKKTILKQQLGNVLCIHFLLFHSLVFVMCRWPLWWYESCTTRVFFDETKSDDKYKRSFYGSWRIWPPWSIRLILLRILRLESPWITHVWRQKIRLLKYTGLEELCFSRILRLNLKVQIWLLK